MQLIIFEINLMLTRSVNYVKAEKATIFAIVDTKLYILAVKTSTQENRKLLQQLIPN